MKKFIVALLLLVGLANLEHFGALAGCPKGNCRKITSGERCSNFETTELCVDLDYNWSVWCCYTAGIRRSRAINKKGGSRIYGDAYKLTSFKDAD